MNELTQAKQELITEKSEKYVEKAKERQTEITLPKSAKQAQAQLEAHFKVKPVKVGDIFEINMNGRLIRNKDPLEALKDLGTISGNYYGKAR
jgi:ribosomal protein L23